MLRPKKRLPGDPQPAPPIEFDVIPVERFNVLLDNGIPLQFDMKGEDRFFEGDGTWLTVLQGSKETKIALSRILYMEKRPAELKIPRVPLAETLAAIRQ